MTPGEEDLERGTGLEGGAKAAETKKKKEKVYPDDTSSFEGVAALPEDDDRRRKRARRHAFRRFIEQHNSEWKSFNSVILLASLVFLVGNYFIGWINFANNDEKDCGNLKSLVYADYILHSANFVVCLINLTGLNFKLCFANLVLGFFVFEIVMLGWKQLIYFKAQSLQPSCMFETPALYWWQFCQILCIYSSMIGFICSFMRKYFPTEEPQSQNDRYDKKTGIALEP